MSEKCPKCGSTEVTKITGFGGFWAITCKICHTVVKSGRQS